jgi:sugar phosphate isomerase/epimerase
MLPHVTTSNDFSRRSFLALAAAVPLASVAATGKNVPVGLELYSVRGDLAKDLMGTVRSVAKMGYECVEFYSPYYEWTADYARQVRKELDDLGIRCSSTHNDSHALESEGIQKAIELNQILGSQYIVMASAGEVSGVDGWKRVAAVLNQAAGTAKAHGLQVGYHNHDAEWKPVEGQKPIEILAANTNKSVMLQLDVGTCLEAGNDPVAWINKNPGRIRSIHCKDWSPDKGYKVLFSEGVAPWKAIFAAAEASGGVEFYLIEQEGSRFPELETVRRCLEDYRKLRAA